MAQNGRILLDEASDGRAIELTCPNCGGKMKVEGRLDVSQYTDKEGQKRTTFRILADTYRLL